MIVFTGAVLPSLESFPNDAETYILLPPNLSGSIKDTVPEPSVDKIWFWLSTVYADLSFKYSVISVSDIVAVIEIFFL